jgi:hypothetical protein
MDGEQISGLSGGLPVAKTLYIGTSNIKIGEWSDTAVMDRDEGSR